MLEFWNGISEPQATIIAAIITVFAAVAGVLLGSLLFGNRVRNLESALSKAEDLLDLHRNNVDARLLDISSKIGALDELLSATMQQLSSLGSVVNDIDERKTVTQADVEHASPAEIDLRESLKSNWIKIRDRIEEIASDINIDGRTRAKYGRIDRRMFYNLIDALSYDGRLGSSGDLYHEALSLWHRYRNGRLYPSEQEAARMEQLSRKLG